MNWLLDRPIRMFSVLGIGAVLAFGGLVALSIQDQKAWEAFSAEHHCQVVGKIAGYATYGYYNGKYQTHYVPSKTVYKCDDGVEYTR